VDEADILAVLDDAFVDETDPHQRVTIECDCIALVLRSGGNNGSLE